MRVRLERIMERYGQPVTLVPGDGGESVETRAFLQPIRKEREDLPVTVTPLGPVSEQRWLYIGQADVEIRAGDQITFGEIRLTVQEVQPIYWQDGVLYRRAILRRKKEAAA